MSSSTLSYLVRGPDGKEYGPVEQDVLVQWARNGRVTESTQVCNTLTKNWVTAAKIPFLVAEMEAAEVAAEDAPARPGVKKQMHYSLNRPGRFHYMVAGVGYRLAALAFDLGVLGLVAAGLLLGGSHLKENLPEESVSLMWLVMSWFFAGLVLLYFTLSMGLTAQSPGQRFFGIMLVRPNGDPVLVGRAFAHLLVSAVLGWSTPLFTLLRRRNLQELLCGTVVCMIVNRDRM